MLFIFDLSENTLYIAQHVLEHMFNLYPDGATPSFKDVLVFSTPWELEMPPPRFPERSLLPSGDLRFARGGHDRDDNSGLDPASGKRGEGYDGKSGPLKRKFRVSERVSKEVPGPTSSNCDTTMDDGPGSAILGP